MGEKRRGQRRAKIEIQTEKKTRKEREYNRLPQNLLQEGGTTKKRDPSKSLGGGTTCNWLGETHSKKDEKVPKIP